MRRSTSLLSAALFWAAVAAPGLAAQGDTAAGAGGHGDNAFHVEAFGPSILGSLNYERMIGSNFSARAGVGWMPGFDIGARLHTPLLEAGAGAVLVYALKRGIEEDESVQAGFRAPYAAGTLAYRLEPSETSSLHGGIYRVGLTPVYSNGVLYPSFGLSAGFYLSSLRGSRGAAIRRR
jgi:hypothetical protein